MPEVQLIRDSFEIVHQMPEAIAMLFYGRLFDLDPAVALSRARLREQSREPDEGRFEQEDLAFHSRVRQGYRDLASAYPQRIRVVEAAGRREEVHARVLGLVGSVYPSLELTP